MAGLAVAALVAVLILAITLFGWFLSKRPRFGVNVKNGGQSVSTAVIGSDADLDAEYSRMESDILAAQRPTWTPVTSHGDAGPEASKFGGIPFLPAGEDWPSCANCHQPMQLFLQLNADDTPIPMPYAGLLQFFYCVNPNRNCETDCEAWAPRARSTLLRIVPISADPRRLDALPDHARFPAVTIRNWTQATDFPSVEDFDVAGIVFSDYLIGDIVRSYQPKEGDKLLGWPAWVQNADYQNCDRCGNTMNVIFQIASEDNIPYMFGDVGNGHISICTHHPEELVFAWACS